MDHRPLPRDEEGVSQEVGRSLESIESTAAATTSGSSHARRPLPTVRFRSQDEVFIVERLGDHGEMKHEQTQRSGRATLSRETSLPPVPASTNTLPTRRSPIMSSLGTVALLLAVVVPLLHSNSFFGHASLPLQPVSGGPIPQDAQPHGSVILDRRDNSPNDTCLRWAQQSAIVNGTLYLYGGQAKQTPTQTSDTWNNNFLSLDLTRTWHIASPGLSGLPQPSGPPNVSLGYLWNSYEALWLYGGEFSSKPTTSPSPLGTWEYNIASQSWSEHSNPQTSSGENAPSNGDPVNRAAEGAGISVPSLGRGFYFGGHLDPYTTPGWAQWFPRVYLQSLLEFTFPGYKNDQVNAFGDGKTAGSDGNYRNITQGGLQSTAGFTQRADGLLMHVPGFGEQGILLALAGGTNETFTQMNNINVYDIASSIWYTQSTSGSPPNIRVNPCAVMAAAQDGSSYNVYMFGGQNLVPAGNQTQYQDMWILTIPSFTWIEVDQGDQSVPYGRSGHTCNIWDGQMVVVGGYVGEELSCESPGVYVYDMSNLQWVNQFTALSPGSTSGTGSNAGSAGSGGSSGSSGSGSSSSTTASSTFNSTGSNNPLNQQPAQLYNATSPGGLEGSYGYQVPAAVISVIGGGPTGGATVTAPVVTADGGPLATGKPIFYTVTAPNGAVTTQTGTPSSSSGNSNNGSSGPNIAAIVVGVIAGLLFLLACYLAFCAYVYRKQLQLYKQHVEMSQRSARGEKVSAMPALLGGGTGSSGKGTSGGSRAPWLASENASTTTGGQRSGEPSSGAPSGVGAAGAGYTSLRRDSESEREVDEDLLGGREPTFVGVMLNPRRSLRVINRD